MANTILQLQRMGLMLGLMAWCMQLVVFVQPFLPGHSMSGLGVCQVIVDAFIQPSNTQPSKLLTQTSHLTQSHGTHQAATRAAHQSVRLTQQYTSHKTPPHLVPHQASYKHQLTQPRHMIQSMLPLSSYPQVDHHFSHLSCGFCILYGHTIPPPEAPALWSQLAIDAYIAPVHSVNDAKNILAADYLQPKSRAPPIIYSI